MFSSVEVVFNHWKYSCLQYSCLLKLIFQEKLLEVNVAVTAWSTGWRRELICLEGARGNAYQVDFNIRRYIKLENSFLLFKTTNSKEIYHKLDTHQLKKTANMSANVVHVKNISKETSEKEIKDFFSFWYVHSQCLRWYVLTPETVERSQPSRSLLLARLRMQLSPSRRRLQPRYYSSNNLRIQC